MALNQFEIVIFVSVKEEIARLAEGKENVEIEKCSRLEEHVEAQGESNMLVCALGNHSDKCEVIFGR